MSVNDVLQLEAVKRALPQVMAGEDSLSRPVRWAHVINAQHPQGLLKGGELVLTTGVGIPAEDEAAQREFIHDLADQGVAAIIGPGAPFGTALSDAMAAAADECALPLIALNRFTRFVEITEAVHSSIISLDLALLRESDEFTRRITEVAYEGGGVPELLRETAQSVHAPVVLESLDHHLVSHEAGEVDEEVLMSMWRHHLASEVHDGIPAPGVHLQPVRLPTGPWGRMICFEVDEPLSAVHVRILEQAADIIGLTLRGQGEVEYLSRSTGSVLRQLAQGAIDERSAEEKTKALGIRSYKTLVPIAAGWRSAPAGQISPTLAWTHFMSRLKTSFEEQNHSLLIGPWDHLLIGVVTMASDEVEREDLDNLAELLHSAREEEAIDENGIAFTIGEAERSWTAIGANLNALAVAGGAAMTQPSQRWFDARRMSVPTLLFGLIDNPNLEVFVRQQLGPLTDLETRRNREMIETIRELAVNGGRRADTARALHLTRQSLYYRLDRIEETLDVDLSSGDVLVALQLAITALPMMNQRRSFAATDSV